ncbi:MAG: hypothetical protein HY721_12200 [Planctomycetes bacterium]|nr:hypothetical protein [Planctomycetota bacterium]
MEARPWTPGRARWGAATIAAMIAASIAAVAAGCASWPGRLEEPAAARAALLERLEARRSLLLSCIEAVLRELGPAGRPPSAAAWLGRAPRGLLWIGSRGVGESTGDAQGSVGSFREWDALRGPARRRLEALRALLPRLAGQELELEDHPGLAFSLVPATRALGLWPEGALARKDCACLVRASRRAGGE